MSTDREKGVIIKQWGEGRKSFVIQTRIRTLREGWGAVEGRLAQNRLPTRRAPLRSSTAQPGQCARQLRRPTRSLRGICVFTLLARLRPCIVQTRRGSGHRLSTAAALMTERLMTPVLYPPEGGKSGNLLSVSNDFMGISQLQAVSKLLYKQGECRVWFADVVQKVGRRGELKPKALVVTSKSLYFLEPGLYTIRTKVPIFGVEEVKMSRFRDNFIAIYHSCIEKDHLLVTTRREVLANCMMDARGRDGGPMLEYTSAFVHRLDAHTVREVSFYEDEDMIIHTKLATKPGPHPTLTTAATPTFRTALLPDEQTSG